MFGIYLYPGLYDQFIPVLLAGEVVEQSRLWRLHQAECLIVEGPGNLAIGEQIGHHPLDIQGDIAVGILHVPIQQGFEGGFDRGLPGQQLYGADEALQRRGVWHFLV